MDRPVSSPWGGFAPMQRMDRWSWLLLAFTLLCSTLIYLPTVNFAFTEWDDPGYVVNNTELGAFSSEQVRTEFHRDVMGNFHPVTMLSYALDIRMGGKEARVFHATNVALHLLNVLLVLLFVFALLGAPRIAVLAALLWALHPMRVETVAWISDRKDLLLVLFGVSSLLAYILFLRRRSWVWFGIAFALLGLACLSKATAVALVPTLVLIDLFAQRSLRSPRVWMEKLPFAVVAVIIGLLTIPAQRTGIDYGEQLDLPLFQRLVLGGANALIYLAQQTVPIGLSAFYGYADAGRSIPGWYPLLWPVLAVAGWLLYRSRREHALVFGALFFLVNIALLLQFTSVGQAMRADRYMYLPGIGCALLVVMCVKELLEGAFGMRVVEVVLMAYALVLGVVSFQRVPVWKDALATWTDMIDHDPQAPIALASRSGTYYSMGNYERALADATAALRARPDDGLARYNRGMALMKLDRHKEALVDLLPFARRGGPEVETALFENVVYGSMRSGSPKEAIPFADSVLRRQPTNTDILNKRAYCWTKAGDPAKAEADITRSLELKSDYAEVWYIKAFVQISEGDTLGACTSLQRCAKWPMKDESSEKARTGLMQRYCK